MKFPLGLPKGSVANACVRLIKTMSLSPPSALRLQAVLAADCHRSLRKRF